MEVFYKVLEFVLKQVEPLVALGIAISAFTMLILLNVFVNVFIYPDLMYPLLAAILALNLRKYYLSL